MKQLALLDVCYPDYFTGYSKPIIAVPFSQSYSNREMSEAIQEEIRCYYDYLFSEHGYSKTELLLMDHYCEELLKDPDGVFIEMDETEQINLDEMEDYAYLYFGIIKPVFRYGLTWLNS
jgi:hypothetical protein